jgi:hypothetical protein
MSRNLANTIEFDLYFKNLLEPGGLPLCRPHLKVALAFAFYVK